MVKVVRTPAIAKLYFTANQLNGWPSGVQFTGAKKQRRRKKQKPVEPIVPPDWVLVGIPQIGKDVTSH